MRLALNAVPLLSPWTGIGQYTYQVARGLLEARDVEVFFFYGTGWSRQLRHSPSPAVNSAKSTFMRWVPNAQAVMMAILRQRFGAGVRKYKPHVYHEPNFLAHPFAGPTVLTVHDLSWIRHPEAHPADRVAKMQRYFAPSLARASLILTDSEFVRQELQDVFSVEPGRIRTVLLGVEDMFRPMPPLQTRAVLDRFGLRHGSYLLAVGTLEPRKNLQLVLRSYLQLPGAVQKEFPLVLAGMSGWKTSALEQQIGPLVQSGHVRLTGYVERADLVALMSGATTLVYPSLYEGFGLPPLEAMACGAPVIASGVASLPEVVGDAGVLVDPHDAQALAHEIMRLVESPSLRAELSRRAIRRAAGFTWQRCVDQTVQAYRDVAAH
ncbi:MAG: glycosyltransferase family 1 protein [Pseudomonadota bacterium]